MLAEGWRDHGEQSDEMNDTFAKEQLKRTYIHTVAIHRYGVTTKHRHVLYPVNMARPHIAPLSNHSENDLTFVNALRRS